MGTKAAIGMHERACDFAVVYCLLRDKGCKFTCQRRELPKHFEMCIRQQELECVCVDTARKLELARQIAEDKPVVLNVGGTKFTVSVNLLCKYPTSLLGILGSKLRKTDRLFLDRDPAVFKNVLTFLRSGRLPPFLSPRALALLEWEAEFLDLKELSQALHSLYPEPVFLDFQVVGRSLL